MSIPAIDPGGVRPRRSEWATWTARNGRKKGSGWPYINSVDGGFHVVQGGRGVSGPTGPIGKTGIPAPPLRAELGRLDLHIDKIYKEIAITVGRIGQIQAQVDELRVRLHRLAKP